ncbi:zinc finger, CCHC-type containing protein, partial [Tanacetum coccineum]
MGDANPIRTLGDNSKPSHKGYKNTIELPDPNQHLKDLLKLVDSLDLDGENRERTRLRLCQFSLRDQASNWIERLPTGSITTWEDLTTRFLAQFFLPGRTAKLRNDILMFQQHQGESLSEAWTRFKDLLQKVPHHGIDLWLQVQIFYDHVTPATRRTIDQSAGGKLRDRNVVESWALLEDLALYDDKSWNDLRDFAKPVKQISLPQDVPNTSDLGMTIKPGEKSPNPRGDPRSPLGTGMGMKNDSPMGMGTGMGMRLINGDGDVVPATLSTTCKVPNKPLLNMHPREPMGREKAVSEKLDDTPIRDTAENPASQMNFTSTNDTTKEELRGKGIKRPSKLLSPKYLSQSSFAEQNGNPSSPKRVHFVNSIVILNKEDEAKEEGNAKSSTTEYKDHEITVESEKEFKEETKEEIEEEEEDSPKH